MFIYNPWHPRALFSLSVLLLCLVLLFNPLRAQVTTSTPVTQTFDADWWAAQPAAVQKCRPSVTSNASSCDATYALRLSQSGVPIDLAIVAWGQSPWFVHLMRTDFGIPYVGTMEGIGPRGGLDPDRPMNVPAEKWSVPPGKIATVYFDAGDPDGTMRRLHALYPLPVPPPKAAPVVTGTNLVGAWWGGALWGPGPGASDGAVTNGQEYVQGGKTFVAVKQKGAGLMDPTQSTLLIYFVAK